MLGRWLRVALLLFAPAPLGCDGVTARVVVDEVRASRRPDGTIDVAVDVTGVEQSGRGVGRYCVSVHWLPPGTDTSFVSSSPTYPGEQEHQSTCTSGLGDGDSKTFRFVSQRKDLVPGSPLRAQAGIREAIETKDIDSP